jgi:hypothetical protein
MTSSPGWHPDPLGRRRWRYFDGDEWTTRTSDVAPSDAVVHPADDLLLDDEDHLTEAQLLARTEVEPDDDELDEDELELYEDEDEDEPFDDELEPFDDEIDLDEDEGLPEEVGLSEDEELDDDEVELADVELDWLDETEDLWAPAPEPELEPEPELVLEPEAEAEPAPVAEPAHLRTSRLPAARVRQRRRRVVVLAVLAVATVAVAGVTVLGGGGGGALDDDHAALGYEGEVLGVSGTAIRLVVDGDDLLEERTSADVHRVSVIRDGTTYDCPLDAGATVCTRTDDEGAAAAVRSSVVLFLEPLSEDGTFGAAAAGAQDTADRTVAGRASKCSTVAVTGRADTYEVCRDARLGFLTYAKGRDLDLTLTSIRAPKAGEIRIPNGVQVEGTTQP